MASRITTFVLAVALVLTLTGGLALRSAAAQELPPPDATGTIVPGMVTIQGIVALDNTRPAGSFDYLIDVTASASVADAYQIAGEGEQAFIAVDATTGDTIGAGATDANGIAVLDGEVGGEFYIQEVDDPNQPFGTNNIFVPDDGFSPAVSVTAIEYVNSGPAPVEPSDAPTEQPSSEPLPPGAITGTILPDAITVQGLVVEEPERAGQTDYLLNVTAAAEAGNFRPAREGEQTYEVYDLDNNTLIDSGSTDANGIVVLDGEVDGRYYVAEIGDTGSFPGTDSLFYPAGDPNAYVALTSVRYVVALDPAPADPSPSVAESDPSIPSPSVADSLEPIVSDSPDPVESDSPNPSVADSSSPAASNAEADADGASEASDDAVVAGDGIPQPGSTASRSATSTTSTTASHPATGAAASRPAAPIISEREDIGTLPNTGTGTGTGTGIGSDSAAMSWLALLIVALVGLVGAGIVIRRRGA